MFKRKKQQAKQEQITGQPASAEPTVKATVKNLGTGDLEFADFTLRFTLKKGTFGKQKDTAIRIPIAEIENMKQEGSQLIVTWNGITDTFAMQNPDLPKMILEKLTSAQSELKKPQTPEQPSAEELKSMQEATPPTPSEEPVSPTPDLKKTIEPEQKPVEQIELEQKATEQKEVEPQQLTQPVLIDYPAMFSEAAEIVDPLFDILRSLQGKINWKRVEEKLKQAKENAEAFTDRNFGAVNLNFAKLSAAVKAHVPGEAGKEGYSLLKALKDYFDSMTLNIQAATQANPNYTSLQTAIQAYYTLNDIVLGVEVYDEEIVKESLEFSKMLDQLTKDTHAALNINPLKDAATKIARAKGAENAVAEFRALFKQQFQELSNSTVSFPSLNEAETPRKPQ